MTTGDHHYTSFSQKYKNTETFTNIQELVFSRKEGFEPLLHVNDLDQHSNYLIYLIKIDLSENLITKLVLRDFVQLKVLLAPRNQIVEVNLILPKLTILDLSTNMISRMINLSLIPNLHELNLSRNIISTITARDFMPVRSSLRKLNLSYNCITFSTVNAFISVIEGLKVFYIEDLSLEGNRFIDEFKYFTKSYKIFIASTVMSLMRFNGTPITIARDAVQCEEIKNQMLLEEEATKKCEQSTYTSFESFYTSPEKYKYITSLEMTPSKGFQLNELTQFEKCATEFINLIHLDVSDNLLKELNLSSLPLLKSLIATRNRIIAVELTSLDNLEEIDLSYNLLTEIPNLTMVKGPVSILNLNWNMISNVELEMLINFKQSLAKLLLSNNGIEFNIQTVSEFTNEILTFTALDCLNLEENYFSKDKTVYNNYLSSFIDHFMKKKLENTQTEEIIELPPFFLDGEDITKIDKPIQLMQKRMELENESSLDDDIIASPIGKFIDKIENHLEEINMIFERLNNFNGTNRVLYLQLLQKIQDLLSESSGNERYERRPGEIYSYDTKFDDFLMNCYALLHLNPDVEIPIFKTIAQLSLFEKGKFFAKKCFVFFAQISKGSEEKKKGTLQIIEETIICTLKDMEAERIPFEILGQIIHYLQTTEQFSRLLYQNLILSITKFMKEHHIPTLLKPENTSDILRNPLSLHSPKTMKTFKTCVKFVREYLKIQSDEENAKGSVDEIENENVDEEEEEEEKTQENEEQKEKEIKDEDNSIDTDSEMSIDAPLDEKPVNLLSDFKYGFQIKDYEAYHKLKINFNTNLTSKRQASKKEIENLRAKIIANESELFQADEIFGIVLNQEIAKRDEITDLQYISSEEADKLADVKYAYIFLNSFKICYMILLDIKDAFKDTTKIGDKKINLCKLALKFFIDLSNTFLDKKIHPKLKEHLRQCNYRKIIHQMRQFLRSFLISYVNDTNSIESLIIEKVLNRRLQNTTESEKQSLNSKKNEMKRMIPVMLECFGCLHSLLNEKNFKQEIEDDFLEILCMILNLPSNNEYVLLGTSNFMKMILRNEFLKSDQMTFSKLMNRVKNFKGLLTYIDYNHNSYRTIFEKISQSEDPDRKMGRDPLDPYSFQNIANEFLIDLFTSVLSVYETLANLGLKTFQVCSIATQTNEDLRSVKLYEVLSNCLIIKSDQVRRLAVECFYYYDHKTITNEMMTQIMNIVNNYSSVSLGETEIILSIIYVILNNKLYHLINSGDVKSSMLTMSTAVKMAVTFLFHNTNRDANTHEELYQKNILSSALILFLITASRYPELFAKTIAETASKQHSGIINFTRILYNDDCYCNKEAYIPIELERTHFGCYLGMLFQTMLGDECIPPYSYTFLRILIKIADVLCECEDFTMICDYSVEYDTLLERLANFEILNRFNLRVTNEKLNWYDFSTNLINYINREDGVQRLQKFLKNERLLAEDMNRTETEIGDLTIIDCDFFDVFMNNSSNTNGRKFYKKQSCAIFKLNRAKKLENEQIINTLAVNNIPNVKEEKVYKAKQFPKCSLDEVLNEHSNFIAFFPSMIMYLLGQTMNIKQSSVHANLSAKYDRNIVESQLILETLQGYINQSVTRSSLGDIAHFSTEIEHTTPISNIVANQVKSKFRIPPEIGDKESRIEPLMIIANPHSFSHIFQTKVFHYNFFEGDIQIYEQFGIKQNAQRKKEDESVNNPHLRTLIIVTFLRCCYSMLHSPSKAIRQHFIEFLFIEEKFKQLILFIDTGLLADYNVAQKGIALIEKIFERINLPCMISACSLYHLEKETWEENKEKDKVKVKSSMKNKNTTTTTDVKNKPSFSMAEGNILHNIYVASLYLEKNIHYFYHNFFVQKKSDPLFLGSVVTALGNLFYAISQIKFDKIDNRFIQYYILDPLAKYESVSLIITMIEYLTFKKRLAFRKSQDLKLKYLTTKYTNIYCGIEGASLEVAKAEINVENYLMNCIYSIESQITKVEELMAGLTTICPNSAKKIWEDVLGLESERDNIIYGEQIYRESNNLEKKKIWQKRKEKNARVRESHFDLLAHYQRLFYNQQYIKEILNIYDIILMGDFCELYDLQKKKVYGTFFILTNKEMLFINITQCDDITTHNPSKAMFDTKSIINPISRLTVEIVDKIAMYDYHNKLVIQTVDDEVYSVTFITSIIAKNLVNNLRSLSSSIKLYSFITIQSMINTLECDDEYITKKTQSRDAIARNINTVASFPANQRDLSECLHDLQAIKKEFPLANAIEEKYYGDNFEKNHANAFLISNDKMTFLDYITYFWRDNQFLIPDKKVMYFSNYYLYLLKEDYSKIKHLPTEEMIFRGNINFEKNDIYQVLLRIRLEEITIERDMENKNKMELKIHYHEADSNKTHKIIDVKFSHFFEFSMFKLKLFDAYDLRWEEDIRSQLKDKEKNIK